MASLMTTMFPLLHRLEILPAGARAQRVDVVLRVSGVRAGEHQNFRLQPHDFFQADVRPFGLRLHDGAAARAAQRVGDKCVAPNRNQRIGPHHEKDAARHGAGEATVEIGKAAAQIFRQCRGRFFRASALPRCSTEAIISSTE